jgi:hypothetical protein
MATQHMPNASAQPPVTEANIRNELEYWLSKIPPHQLLQIIADKYSEVGKRRANRLHNMEMEAASQVLGACADLLFKVWNQ